MPPTPLVVEFSGFGRNGRPGSRGSRESARPEARGLLGGNEAKAGHRWQGEPKGSLDGAAMPRRRDKKQL